MNCESLQTLIDTHGAAMQLVARQYCNHPDDAVQEAFIALVSLTALPRDPVAWLFTTVRRQAMNMARSDARRQKHHAAAGEMRPNWFVADPTTPNYWDDCQAALEQITPENREIVILRIWGEQSFEQIAQVVQLPLSTVHRRYHSTLVKLETLIEPARTIEKKS